MSITRIGTYSQIKGTTLKIPTKVATTANITLSGTQTIDTVVLSVDDRVLVKNQNTSSDNGIYVVKSGSWERSVDFSLDDDVYEGVHVYVNEGATNSDRTFILTTPDPIILGTSFLDFASTNKRYFRNFCYFGVIRYFSDKWLLGYKRF